jgi:hypothetical protein
MNAFTEGSFYTRKQIARELGGGTQNFLPHKGKHVVCGCFRPDLNPNAPVEVLPGNTDDKRRWAAVFASQAEAIPIFIKRGTNCWEYLGRWRCTSKSTNPTEINEAKRQARRTDISMVLRLVKS